MSAPATSTRQRTNATSTLAPNTDSDGVDHSTSAPQGKKLKQQDFTSFTSKLVLAGLAVCLFYGWRLSVQSAEVGGWWNLMRGRHPEAISINDQKATSSSLSSAASSATGYAAARPTGGVPSVHNQILELANSLGVKPRELTLAIAPLLNPSIVSAYVYLLELTLVKL
ncbi:hypothetical protein BDY24DRAFT_402948 [Mrakia frigida]|uniref:uncharacterized protein n=1 Tax=Mrakia frigida TaxID=29902 RepID=UPI003FCC1561